MQYNVENSDYAVEFTAVNMDVAVTGQAEIEAVIGNAAQIDVGEAINYIKSGQAEIEQAVATGTAAFNLNATQKTDAFNANAASKTATFDNNASNKTNAFNQNATDKTNAYNSNATDKTTDFDNNASAKTNAYNDNATAKLSDFDANATNKINAFNQNATDKTTAFNLNATNKTTDFNNNASAKTTAFNDNYTVKKGLIDAEVANAAASATAADNSAKEAKQWAIGSPSEPTGNSAKYWADEAAATVGNCANVDLSNLSATGEAKFDAKQDVISDLTTIRSGAALGATAVQPNDNISELNNNVGYITGITSSDITTALGYTPYNSSNPSGYITSSALTPYALSASLATVATSGSYNDLLNKPTIPTVNDATLTITQGGVSKGTFTANASSNVTIALDSGGGSSLTAGTGIDITNDVISVDGVKDQRNTSTAIKTWTGTKAQYDAIVSKDSTTLYNITDDASGTINVYNKAQVDTLLNNKADINLSNVSNNIDYIIETKLASGNDTTWYRIYKSGWIEQGGRVSISCTANVPQSWSANFPKEMADTNYNYSLALKSGWIYETSGGTESYATTFLNGFINTTHNQEVILTWEVKGQKA